MATLTGYASVFDVEAHGEVVRPTAFNKTLADGADVRLLVNHDGVPLARTKSKTLRLSVDETGLRVDADLDTSNPTVAELASAMGRGDIDQMSFAFVPVTERWDDETGLRELLEVKLRDVSVVTYPWYEDTTAELNSAAALVLAEARNLPDDLAAQLRDAIRPAESASDRSAAARVELARRVVSSTRSERAAAARAAMCTRTLHSDDKHPV